MQKVSNDHKHGSMLIFNVSVEGEVSERQIYGALYNHTDVFQEVWLSSLQREGCVGKCVLEKNDYDWTLRIPFTMPLPKAALLAASIEAIDNVAGHKAVFKLTSLITPETTRLKIARKAKEIEHRLLTQELNTP